MVGPGWADISLSYERPNSALVEKKISRFSRNVIYIKIKFDKKDEFPSPIVNQKERHKKKMIQLPR